MRASLIKIGNSKGIRIPKVVLEELNIEDAVDIDREGSALVIKPVRHRPRQGWDGDFSLMHRRREDTLLIDEGVEDLETLEWK